MPLLEFTDGGTDPSRFRKSPKFLLGIGALIAAVVLGSTLASSISLNGGGPVEFGQGITQTTACDNDVTLTPFSTFVNDEEDADFFFTSFSVTGISEACDGKTFTIKAYNNGDNSPLNLYRTGELVLPSIYSEVKIKDVNGSFSFVGGALLSDDIEDISTGFTVSLVTNDVPTIALASAQDIDRITIESDATGVVVEPVASGDGSQGDPGSSASQIKRDYPDSQSGWYWITNTNIQSGTPFQIYADMSDPDGPWTLVLANGHESSWTPSQLLRNRSLDLTPPTITNNLAADGVKYSILEWADFLKKSVGTNQLEIRITAPSSDLSDSGDFSGVWRAPFDTSFIGTTASVALSRVNVSGGSVRDVMPYLTTNGINDGKDSLTMCSGNCWWDTLAASTSFGGGMPFDTPRKTIMYWVRS